MIELIHLRKEFETVTPLRDVNAVIKRGDVISVIGPSGTGKSTLLRCMNLIDPPTDGRIIFEGEDITAPGYDASMARRRIGMVFQSFNLFGHLTVVENIMFSPVETLGVSRQDAYDKAMQLLKQVGLADRALSYPDELSGGQKQRVAIARALAMDPDVILLDEPTSALDPSLVGEVEAVIKDLAQSGKTMLIVTHDMRFSRSICNRVFYMDEGGIYDDDVPEVIFDAPRKEKTRRFIKQLKVLELMIESDTYDFLGDGAEVDMYCYRNQLSPKHAYRIRSAIEELVRQILLPELADPKISAVVEYSEKSDRTTITVRYNGPPFDPEDTENDLALSMLRIASDSIVYDRIDEDGFTNRVTMELSQS
ncbi:MAG: ATP-binding cassette domain-containing protein [Mogibacterium sp.]|nr:ATP-binding cassette domain-containing protein [Mogibacterium sp.]